MIDPMSKPARHELKPICGVDFDGWGGEIGMLGTMVWYKNEL